MDERYSIEVNDDYVVIYGDLTIEEAFDFLNFFDKKGYKSLSSVYDKASICMSRNSIEQKQEEIRKAEHESDEKFYENLYQESKERVKKLERDILSLEQLIKDLMTDEKKKQSMIQREYESLKRSQMMLNLKNNPEVQQAMENFYGCVTLSRPMTDEEKKLRDEELSIVQNYLPKVPVPNEHNERDERRESKNLLQGHQNERDE